MKIAICDDEQQYVNEIRCRLNEFIKLDQHDISISEYLSPNALLSDTSKKRFDVLFLDIAMPEMNGLDLAERIRALDSQVLIVFVTFMEDHMPRGFDVMASGFIVKPIDKSIFEKTVEKLLIIYRRKNIQPYEVILRGGQKGIIQLSEILYLESRLHTICAVTKSSECEYWGKLSQEKERLSQCGFAQIHRSFLVNMAWVWIVGNKSISFTNGRTLPIGPKYFNDFYNSYQKFRRGFRRGI